MVLERCRCADDPQVGGLPDITKIPVLEGANKTGEQNAKVCFRCTFGRRGRRGSESPGAAAGEKVFGVCKACHQIGETAKNNVGPVLNGLIGRKAGSVAGYSYSAANKDSGITWDEATFREYIKDPKAKIPGTKMIYTGLKDEQRTNDLIAFLKQFDAEGKKK